MGSEVNSEEHIPRARSFRCEDYDTRRVFLRSYPLHWGGEDEEDQNQAKKEKETDKRVNKGCDEKEKPIKKLMVSVFQWGEESVIVLRKFKHKITLYIITCLPVGFKPATALISA